MANRRMNFIGLLRTRPDVRREYALCWGLLISGYCLHGWIDASLIPRMAESLTPMQAANLGGLVAGAVAVVVGVSLGWLAGRWLIEFQHPAEFTESCGESRSALGRLWDWFDLYPLSRRLSLGALLLSVGAVLGFWWLLASLVMVVAFSLGYWGRAIMLRTMGQEI